MQTQIDLLRQQMRWEPYKAVAAVSAGVAAMAGVILAVAHFIGSQPLAAIVMQVPASQK